MRENKIKRNNVMLEANIEQNKQKARKYLKHLYMLSSYSYAKHIVSNQFSTEYKKKPGYSCVQFEQNVANAT